MWDPVRWLRIELGELGLPALGVQSTSYWAIREVPGYILNGYLKFLFSNSNVKASSKRIPINFFFWCGTSHAFLFAYCLVIFFENLTFWILWLCKLGNYILFLPLAFCCCLLLCIWWLFWTNFVEPVFFLMLGCWIFCFVALVISWWSLNSWNWSTVSQFSNGLCASFWEISSVLSQTVYSFVLAFTSCLCIACKSVKGRI